MPSTSSPPSSDAQPVATTPSSRGHRSVALGLVVVGTLMMSFNDLARVGGWSFSDLLYVGAAFVVLMDLLAGRTRHLAPTAVRRTPPLMLVTSLVLLTGGTMSSLWSLDPFSSIMIVVRFAWLTMIWFWVIRAVSPDRAAIGRIVWAYKIAVLIGAATAVLGDMGVPISPDSWSGRQAGYWGHPNSLAAFLVVGLPFFVLDVPRPADRPEGRSLLQRFLLSGFVLVGIGTTGSMTGLMAALAGVSAVLVIAVASGGSRLRFRPLTAMAVMVAVGAALLVFFTSDSPVVERLTAWRTGDTYVSGSVDSRGRHSDVVISRLDQRLLLGVGFDRESIMQSSGEDAALIDTAGGVHNMILKLTYEAGVPACAAVVLLLIATASRGWRLARFTRGTALHPLVLALIGSFVAINLNAQFQPVLFRRYFWFPVALIWALYALCRNESRQRHDPA